MNFEDGHSLVEILHNTSLLLFLKEDVLELAITCKAVFQELCAFINKNILFRYPGESNLFQWYHPQRLRIGGYFGAAPHNKKDLFKSIYQLNNLPPKHFEFHPNLLPSTLTHLTFGPNFNSPIDNLLPHSLTHLSFEEHEHGFSYFNQSIDHLPPSLTHLSLPASFKQPIDHLPHSLTHLSFSETSTFAQPINNLPSTLIHLSLGYYNFKNTKEPITLPSSLKHLAVVVSSKFSGSLDFLPNLTYLNCKGFSHDLVLPDSLVELHIDFPLKSSLPNLQILSCNEFRNGTIPQLPSLQSLETWATIHQVLPPTLLSLHALGGSSFYLPLPSSLTSIQLSLDETAPRLIQNVLSLPNLTSINIRLTSWDLNVIQPLTLPPKLTQLTLYDFTVGGLFTTFLNLIQFTSAPLLSSLSIHKRGYHTQYEEVNSDHLPSLTSLELENIKFQGQLPPSLQNLSISLGLSLSRQTNPFMLPPLPNLTRLYCSNVLAPPSFPSTLKHLTFDVFEGALPPLPDGLHYLSISGNIEGLPLLPSSLITLLTYDSILPTTVIPPRLKIAQANGLESKEMHEFPLTLEYVATMYYM